ncbi:MAG: RNA polymerase factor sigma-54 [Bacteroidales bacterium]|nr:RNA polymerase factor sigma-54 [Bacteroidales bacterium]
MLRQRLQQKLLQKLSPQQIQTIKLLEIPTIELEQRIKKEIEENPVLENGAEEPADNSNNEDEVVENELGNDQDEFSLNDYLNDEDIPTYKLNSGNYSKEERKTEIPFSVGDTFYDHLEAQLGLRRLTEKQKILGQHLLGNIDEDGYLRRKPENIVDDLAFSMNISATEDEIFDVLYIIQDFDPPGVCAMDLQECLLLQIERKDEDDPLIKLARQILKYHFEEFTKKHYDKIITRLDITEEELKEAIDEILKLNPKPGSSYSDPLNKTVQHIVPDFIVETREGDLQLTLNSRNVPDLHVSRRYADMLESYKQNKEGHTKVQKEAVNFVRQKLDSAKWFIDAIKQRHNTLLLTMQAILEYQYAFFEDEDDVKLRPMILKDIAEMTHLDISTISRVANSKYVQTPFSIYPLKFFFSEGLMNEEGEEVSTREIKKILKECVENENKKKPVTDEKLAIILKEKGYRIARRTVAKYREQLNIPVARLRKEL